LRLVYAKVRDGELNLRSEYDELKRKLDKEISSRIKDSRLEKAFIGKIQLKLRSARNDRDMFKEKLKIMKNDLDYYIKMEKNWID
jgi:hypothetical protein